jgi:hypothetical protein
MTQHDKIHEDAEHYRLGLTEAFGVNDDPSQGIKAMERYEAGMRAYHEDPVAPIERRLRKFLDKLEKVDPDMYEAANLAATELRAMLRSAVLQRNLLVALAEKEGIKLKKGIMI